MNMTRCLRNEAQFPKPLWGEIAASAVFFTNRPPHRIIGGDTPYYRMFVKQINLSFLRTIRARAPVHMERCTIRLQEKAWERVLVGYDNDSRSFRVYVRTGKAESSRNVSFIDQPPAVIPTTDEQGGNIMTIEICLTSMTSSMTTTTTCSMLKTTISSTVYIART